MNFKTYYEAILNEPKYNIYLDMDGVICNFGGAIKKVGVTVDLLNNDADKAWELIDGAGEEFWSDMDWMPDGKLLWNYIKKYKPTILSAPSRNPQSKTGKRKWIDKELGKDVSSIFVQKQDKQKYAAPYSILIDDHKKNISQWEEAGGIGILHSFNSEHTIKALKELGL